MLFEIWYWMVCEVSLICVWYVEWFLRKRIFIEVYRKNKKVLVSFVIDKEYFFSRMYKIEEERIKI